MAQGCTDLELAAEVHAHLAAGRDHLLVIANRFTAKVLASRPIDAPEWVLVGQGDIGNETAALLDAAGKRRRLKWQEVAAAEVHSVGPSDGQAVVASSAAVKAWRNARDGVTSGRNGEVTAKTRFEVASLAGWRCQFDGCGDDLRSHFVPGASNSNYSYFAHIIASSSDGPRGDPVRSPRLCDEPSNIMLMCDKCHRLIDRVAPDRYDVELLQEMRERNVAEVRRLLDILRFPAAQMLVIGGNIEGQSFAFDQRVAEEAMWLRGVRMATPQAQWFARNGAHLGASNSPGYWLSLFDLLKHDIPVLKGLLTGTSHGGAPRPPLAVLPLHGTSVLVLSGRLIGESSTVHLFQFDRDQVGGTRGGQWAWPTSEKPTADKFKVRVLREAAEGESEALLRVCLTASPSASELPSNLATAGDYVLPTVEVTVDSPTYRSIGHPDDHALLGKAIGEALERIHDQWHIRTVHVIAIAPTTACFRLGQKMQARHQPDFILYERKPGAGPGARGTFEPTIRISSTAATLVSTGASIDIS